MTTSASLPARWDKALTVLIITFTAALLLMLLKYAATTIDNGSLEGNL